MRFLTRDKNFSYYRKKKLQLPDDTDQANND